MKFNTNVVTHIPTECLIEDYQALVKAIKTNDWSEVQCVIECLSDSIGRFTEVPEGMKFHPSGNSAIAMSVDNGIISNDDGSDLKCQNGLRLSDTQGCTGMIGEDPSAHKLCPYFSIGACSPMNCQVLLNDGHIYVPFKYDDEIVLKKDGTVKYNHER